MEEAREKGGAGKNEKKEEGQGRAGAAAAADLSRFPKDRQPLGVDAAPVNPRESAD